MDYLVAIADTASVSVDWLATGRLPKTRAELRQAQPAPVAQALDPERLRLALKLAEDSAAVQSLTPDQRADLALAFYQRLSKGESP